MSAVLDALNALPLAGLMLVIALGFSLGRLAWRDLSPGPAAATLLCALPLGHLGLRAGTVEVPDGGLTIGAFGFALFIYSVGFDAAPHFFSSFREARGWRFVAVGVFVNAVAVVAAYAAARMLELDASRAAGLLAGALTSAPTYAAAFEVAPKPTELSVAFAVTYPFGLIGLVLLIQVVPRLHGADLAGDAVSDDEIRVEGSGAAGPPRPSGPAPEITRAFEVRQEDCVGKSLRELDLTRSTGCVISRMRQGRDVFIPNGDTVLELGDRVMVTGRVDELRVFQRQVGPEVDPSAFHGAQLPTRRIQVRRREVAGKSLAELRLMNEYRCVVTRIERGALWIEPDADVTLVRNDILEVVGRRNDLRALAAFLGGFEASHAETDVAVYAGGILLGVLLGSIHVHPFGVDLTLGFAGGLLLVGLLLGAQQRIGPFRTYVPREARQLVRDLGILLFVGETGLDAGAGIASGLDGGSWQTFLAGMLVNVVTVGAALVLALAAFRLRPIDAWGSICGGLTSSAGLQAVRRASDSNEAAISYAAAYAVASVLATLAGPLLVLLLR